MQEFVDGNTAVVRGRPLPRPRDPEGRLPHHREDRTLGGGARTLPRAGAPHRHRVSRCPHRPDRPRRAPGARALASLPGTARIYAEAKLELPDTAAQVVHLDLTPVAREVGRDYVALWALAHVAEREGLITAEALADTAQRTTPSQFREETLRTLRSAAVVHEG